jgi:serine/threonine-protein kinase
VYELAEDPDTHEPMLAMEFISGQNLEQIVRRARKRKVPLPPEFVGRIAHEVLLALHFAHAFVEPSTGKPMAVVHRDINPRNVMVTYTGGTKIVDFGIAKARGRLNETHVGFVKGTLSYMAPEQVTAKGVDGRTDLFAASVLFYELFSGRRLFDEPSDAAIMNRVAEANVPSLAQVCPSLPAAAVEAVMKGLQRSPEQRWQTGREYARALDRALAEPFDDQQMAELMGRLFEDKIAVTRALLASTGQASPYEEAPRDVQSLATSPGRGPGHLPPEGTERTEMNLSPVSEPTLMHVLPKEGKAPRPEPKASKPDSKPELKVSKPDSKPELKVSKPDSKPELKTSKPEVKVPAESLPEVTPTGNTPPPPTGATMELTPIRNPIGKPRSRPELAAARAPRPLDLKAIAPWALGALLIVIALLVLVAVVSRADQDPEPEAPARLRGK